MSNLSRRALLQSGAAFMAASGLTSTAGMAADAHGHARPAEESDDNRPQVYIGENEFSDGPSEAARRAVAAIIPSGGRYLDDLTPKLVKLYSGQLGVPDDHVTFYPGSFVPLNWTSLAFTSPTAGLVAADPTFTVGIRRAALIKTPLHLLPLRSNYTHDTDALTRAAHEHSAGLIYICSPNNPTGTVTPRADIESVIDNKPKDTVVVVDEAYIHFTDERSVADLAAAGKDVVVLRSFSKIYGLAGLRLGAAIARPDLLDRLNRFGFTPLPITAKVAAIASLEDPHLVPTRKKAMTAWRTDLVEWFKKKGYSTSPSDASFFLVDVKRPGDDFIRALKARGVHVGRVWQPYATAFRLTIGNPHEIAAFKREFTAVERELSSVPPTPSNARLRDDVGYSSHDC